MTLLPGEVFASHFRVERLLGAGGFGEVHDAVDLRTNAHVALKILLRDVIAHPTLRERFDQESRITSLFASPHVVPVVDASVDSTTGRPWVAFKLLVGETLTTRLKRDSALSPDLVSSLFAQLGAGLGAAHQAGVIHADIKPDNLFLCGPAEAPSLKILDFGIARILKAGSTSTQVTTEVGSPEWTAPEQFIRGARLRSSTDVWPLGMIAFRALTGAHYLRHGGDDFQPLPCLGEIVTAPLPAASERARELGVESRLPKDFDRWFQHCVTRKADERFQHGRAATNALLALLRPTVSIAPTEALAEPPISPLPAVRAMLDRSDYTGARRELDVAITAPGSSAEVWALRGECDQRLGRYDDAVDDWSEAIARAPACGDYLLGRSFAFEAQGKLAAARADVALAAALGHGAARDRLRRIATGGERT